MDTIGIMFGRFNPPHQGHVNAWNTASNCDYYYIGTNPNTLNTKNPLPFTIKKEIMETICPEIIGHIIPTSNLFTLAGHVYNNHGENVIINIFTDEEWLYKTLLKYNGIQTENGYYKFKIIANVKTPRLSSSTNLKEAIKSGDTDAIYKISGISLETEITINNKVYKIFDIINQYI